MFFNLLLIQKAVAVSNLLIKRAKPDKNSQTKHLNEVLGQLISDK